MSRKGGNTAASGTGSEVERTQSSWKTAGHLPGEDECSGPGSPVPTRVVTGVPPKTAVRRRGSLCSRRVKALRASSAALRPFGLPTIRQALFSCSLRFTTNCFAPSTRGP